MEIEHNGPPGRRAAQRTVSGQIRAERFLGLQQALLCLGVTGRVETMHPQRQTDSPHRFAGSRETGISNVGWLQDRILLVLVYPWIRCARRASPPGECVY